MNNYIKYKRKGRTVIKRDFQTWLKTIHNMTMEEYYQLNIYQQKALQLEYNGW